ncbi:transglutaminase-like enzyme; cysteine protease [unidentified eubacterium SCB49]|nr:transglutaminase-like enzyme; cysteine protease [unidentified eubacterium SCB49]
MKKKLILMLLLIISFTAVAQRGRGAAVEDIATAKALKFTYPEEDIVQLSKETSVTFKKNSKKGLVEATTKKQVSFLNISPSAVMQYPVFYDAESEVKTFNVADSKGRFNAVGSAQVKDEYLKDNDLFHTDYRVKYVNLNFQLQGIRKKIKTEKKYNDVKYFTSEYFIDSYRIQEGKLIVHIPDWLTLELKEFNFEGYDISKESIKDDDGHTITYTFKNIAPQANEPNTPGPSHIYPHVLFIAKSYTDDGKENNLFRDVSDLYAWYNSLVKNINVDASVYSEKVKDLTKGATTDVQKVKNIFYWVQDNIRYIAFEDGIAGFQPDSPQNVFTKRYGDCKGMAILTKSMLEEAGLDSRLVWIGTDRLAYDYSIPSLSVDNHMICAVQLEGETIFLDGTEKYNRFGDYATRIQNKQALLQDSDSFKVLTVPKNSENLNRDKTSYDLSISDEQLVGNVNRFYGGECRVEFQNIYTNFGKGDQEEVLSNYLTGGNSNLKVKEIAPFDVEERDEDLNIKYMVDLGSSVSEFDGVLYVDIDPVKVADSYILKNRKADYKTRMNRENITEVLLEIPIGYEIGELPKPVTINNDLVSLSVSYKKENNKIRYTKAINLKERWIKKKDFELWNSSFEILKDNGTQQITLIKQ